MEEIDLKQELTRTFVALGQCLVPTQRNYLKHRLSLTVARTLEEV